jgi:N6-L-threonylcarbamoyladenine synthase
VLVTKTIKAAGTHHAESILISGGVAANLRLRDKFEKQLIPYNLHFFAPPVTLCTDNAVYIAAYAFFRGKPESWKTIGAQPDLSVENI